MAHTFVRVTPISGGESFMAALSLARGEAVNPGGI